MSEESKPAKLWGVWMMYDTEHGWWRMNDAKHGPLLAREDEARAGKAAADEFGFGRYEDAKEGGWCEVRPLT